MTIYLEDEGGYRFDFSVRGQLDKLTAYVGTVSYTHLTLPTN